MSAIFKRDLRSYFTTPVGYVYMAIFLAVNGGAFSMFTIQEGSDSKVASYFTTMISPEYRFSHGSDSMSTAALAAATS